MQRYLIQVRNEFTGDVRVIEVHSGHGADAQVTALHLLFKQEGWRKATALLPEMAPESHPSSVGNPHG